MVPSSHAAHDKRRTGGHKGRTEPEGLAAGKVVLVTGATNGIGLEACVTLAREGATLVMVGRDADRTEAALAHVRSRSGSKTVSSLLCDFGAQSQIRKVASEFRAKHERLDVLVNNAGALYADRTLTGDGIEATFAVNHLGYYLLTRLLLDLLENAAPGARIVNVASGAHYRGKLELTDLNYEHGGYSLMKAYSRSKLANVLFTRELSRRLDGKRVTANCLHPGVVATGLWANAPWYLRPVLQVAAKLFFISAEKGGETITQLALDPKVEGITGEYFSDVRPTQVSPAAKDNDLAARLWMESAKLVKLDA